MLLSVILGLLVAALGLVPGQSFSGGPPPCDDQFTRAHGPANGVWWVGGEHRTAPGTADIFSSERGWIRVEVLSEGEGPQALRIPPDESPGTIYRTNRSMWVNGCLDAAPSGAPDELVVTAGAPVEKPAPRILSSVVRFRTFHEPGPGALLLPRPWTDSPLSVGVVGSERTVPVLELTLDAETRPLLDMWWGNEGSSVAPYPLATKAGPSHWFSGLDEESLRMRYSRRPIAVHRNEDDTQTLSVELSNWPAGIQGLYVDYVVYDADTALRTDKQRQMVFLPPDRQIYGLFCGCVGVDERVGYPSELLMLLALLVPASFRARRRRHGSAHL